MLIPPFPWINLIEHPEVGIPTYLATLISELDQQDLLNSLTRIQNALTSRSEDTNKKYLALLHAEILFRLGNITTASSQLKLIGNTYQNESVGIVSRYLNFLISAQKGHYHLAHTGIKRLLQTINTDSILIPFLQISLIETGLMLQQTAYVSDLIMNVEQITPEINQRLQIRTADAYQSKKKICGGATALYRIIEKI